METLAAFNLLVDGMVLTSRIAVQNRLSDLQYFVLNMMVRQIKYFPKIPNHFHAEHPMQFPKSISSETLRHFISQYMHLFERGTKVICHTYVITSTFRLI